MRIILALCLFTLFQCASKKQIIPVAPTVEKKSHKEEIEERLMTYLDLMNSGQFEKMLDITYPKLFDIVPKEQMLKMMMEMFSDEEMKMSMSDMKIVKVHNNLVKTEDEDFTLVDYKVKMKMALSGEALEAIDFIKAALKNQYGPESVTYDKEDTTLIIDAINQMVAIKQNDKWYFVENGKQQEPIIKMLFDEKIRTELGM